MKRQAKGSGSIRKRPDGRWEARVTMPDGTRKSIYAQKQGQARKAMTQMLTELQNGSYVDQTNMTVAQWMSQWIENFVDVKYSTKARYQMDIRRTIIPYIGSIKLKDLTTMNVQRMYAKCKMEGLSAKSIRNIHGVVYSALKKASRLGMIKKNVAQQCQLPKVRKNEMNPLTDQLVKAFLQEAKSDKYYPMYFVDLFTGMRQSQLIGLTWDCVDFDKGTIRIYRQYVRTQKSTFGFSTLKNDRQRTIQPAPQVMEMLEQVKADQQVKSDLNLVFTQRNGSPVAFWNLYEHLKRIAQRIGFPQLRVHDLRHTYATLSLQNGADIKTLSMSLGHATAAFTLDRYGHVSNAMRRSNAQKMMKFIDSI